jgi:hypothetical protein
MLDLFVLADFLGSNENGEILPTYISAPVNMKKYSPSVVRNGDKK